MDIERQSGVADGIWELKQDRWLQPSQIVERPRTICFAFKWWGEDEVFFHAEWEDGPQALIEKAHSVFDEATHVVGWNSKRFDVPHLRTEMALLEMRPPSPHVDVDLMLIAKRQFRFLSNRLNYVAGELGCGGKVDTGGGDLWRTLRHGVGEELWAARRLMRDYNVADVELTERVLERLLPFASGLNVAAFHDDSADVVRCGSCGSDRVQWRGVQVSATRRYRRFQCQECGRWGRAVRSEGAACSAGL